MLVSPRKSRSTFVSPHSIPHAYNTSPQSRLNLPLFSYFKLYTVLFTNFPLTRLPLISPRLRVILLPSFSYTSLLSSILTSPLIASPHPAIPSLYFPSYRPHLSPHPSTPLLPSSILPAFPSRACLMSLLNYTFSPHFDTRLFPSFTHH